MATRKDIEQLFNVMTDRYDDMIRRICATYSTARISADDLYQESMLSLWKGLGSFRGDAALSTWVYRICINSCISFLRRTQRHNASADIAFAYDIADEGPSVHTDDSAYLRYLISLLNEIDKAIILMWLDDRSYAEIADVTGLSTNVIGVRLSRIRTRLQREYQTENNPHNTI